VSKCTSLIYFRQYKYPFCQTDTHLDMTWLHSIKAVYILHLNHSVDGTVRISRKTAGSRSPTRPISTALTHPTRYWYT